MAQLDLSDAKTVPDKVAYWFNELAAARKREQAWRTEANRIVKIYEADGPSRSPDNVDARKVEYNILFSNTETLSPALYNTTPRPEVKRKYKDEDAIAKAATVVTQRLLEYYIDDGQGDTTAFDDLMRQSVLESLVPGRGVTRYKFDAKVEGDQGAEKAYGERVCGEFVSWDRILFGYARTWERLPWLAFEHHMTEAEVEKNFLELKGELVFEDSDLTEGVDGEKADKTDGEGAKGEKLACIYEIWDKERRKVIFVSPCFKQDYMKEVDDPLDLTGFFPVPKTLQLVQKISSMVPTPLYRMYEDQARELNIITVRLNKLIAACRVRGAFDASVKGLEEVLSAEDNRMLPIDNVAALANMQGLEKAIWLFPIDKIIGVIQQLYVARQQIKGVIFEITGIADIMRGSSQASETLGAQEIKNQWGTLRLKRSQKEVMRYVRDSLRIVAEISVTKLPASVVKKMTNVPYPLAEEKQAAEVQVQQIQQEAQMLAQQAAMQAQATGQPPQPPQPPQIPPELQSILGLPTLEEVLDLLKNDQLRSYRVDIETNSTVDAEATEDKQNISELLNAMAQFLNGVAPLIEQGILPFEAAKSMLLTIARRFRFGDEVEEQLKLMAQPKPKEDPKAQAEQAKMQQELEKGKMEMAASAEDREFQKQMKMQDAQLAQQKHAMEMEKLQMEKEVAVAEFQMKMAELQAKQALQKASAESAMMQTVVTAQANAEAGQTKIAQQREGAEIKNKQMHDQAAMRDKQMKQQAKEAAKPKPKSET